MQDRSAGDTAKVSHGRKRRMMGMRRRWIITSVFPVITILMLIAALSSVVLVASYYSNARFALENKARAGASYFNTYAMANYSEYYRNAVLYAGNFDEADTIELQFLDRNGRVEISSRGQTVGITPETPEVRRALDTGRMDSFTGRDPLTRENILAVSAPLEYDGGVVGALRLVTSTRELDKQVALLAVAVMGLAAVISGVVLCVNLVFMRRIAAPVAEVTEAAKRISDGSYGIQIPNKYEDEMGQLVDNINQMSLQISRGADERLARKGVPPVHHALAQGHGIPLAGAGLHHVGVANALQRAAVAKLALAQHGIHLLRDVRPHEVPAREQRHGVVEVGAALGHREHVAAVYLIQVRPLGILRIEGVARGYVTAFAQQLARGEVYFLNPDGRRGRMLAARKLAGVGQQVAPSVVVPEDVGVNSRRALYEYRV